MKKRRFLALSAAGLVGATSVAVYRRSKRAEEFPISLKPGYIDSGFDADSTAKRVTDGLDLSGKNILVTGCNSGLGYETMRVLALRGAHVIGTGRTVEKATMACASVAGTTTPLALELTDFDSILKCAEDLLALGIPLDGLVLNAGISGRPEKQLVHGIEKAFFVNYLGHFLFANKILAAVEAAEQGRIVHVSSSAAYTRASAAGIRFDALGESEAGGQYDHWEYYGQSKLANALFSLKLAKNYENTRVTSNALHPGFVKTDIARGMDWKIRTASKVLGPVIARNVEEGAATMCYAASHPNMAKVSGQFLYNSNVVAVDGNHHLDNHELAGRLWDYSKDVLSKYLA